MTAIKTACACRAIGFALVVMVQEMILAGWFG